MAKPSPYIKEAIKDNKVFDEQALSMRELINAKGEGYNAVRKWLDLKLSHGEWESVWKHHKRKGSVMAYRPKR